MSWVNKHKLPAMKAIKYNDQPCLTINNLWNTLHSLFNTALYCHVDINILNEIDDKLLSSWNLFSKEEFMRAITNYNNSFTPGLNKLLWSHLKTILKDNGCLNNIIRIANTCINLCYRLKPLGLDERINSCIGVTQENLIEISLQTSLSYILLLMVHANYCAPYPK